MYTVCKWNVFTVPKINKNILMTGKHLKPSRLVIADRLANLLDTCVNGTGAICTCLAVYKDMLGTRGQFGRCEFQGSYYFNNWQSGVPTPHAMIHLFSWHLQHWPKWPLQQEGWADRTCQITKDTEDINHAVRGRICL